MDAIFTRRRDGWGARDDVADSPHLVAAFSIGRIKMRMWRLSPLDCCLDGTEEPLLVGGESRVHARLKAAAARAMMSEGVLDADFERPTVAGRADVYSPSRRWIVECGNTRFGKLQQAVMHDSHPRFTLLPYQTTRTAGCAIRGLIAIDFEWSRALTTEMQEKAWTRHKQAVECLELDDLPALAPSLSGRN